MRPRLRYLEKKGRERLIGSPELAAQVSFVPELPGQGCKGLYLEKTEVTNGSYIDISTSTTVTTRRAAPWAGILTEPTNNTVALESDFSSEVAFRHPFITSIVKSANQVQLSFTTILGKVYRVKQSSSVPNSINSWTTAGSVNGTGSPVQLTIPNAVSSQLFYLIEQLP